MGGQPRKSSPWPLLVALGVATAEFGVLFGLAPVAVGGVVVFGGSAAGMAREAGVTESAWRPLWIVGVVIGLGAAAVWSLRSAAFTPDAFLAAAATDAIAVRAAVVLGAATILIAGGFAGAVLAARR